MDQGSRIQMDIWSALVIQEHSSWGKHMVLQWMNLDSMSQMGIKQTLLNQQDNW